jgi:uracil-DNA glycosylase family 4
LDPHVFGSGNVNARVMFVGEAPGADEVIQKKPLEDRILAPAGLRRSQVYTTNAVLCRPNEKNRTPLPTEIDICRFHLDAQILLVNPSLIVTLGNAPLFAVCETTGITKKRGSPRWSREWSNGECVPVLPMFHPAYCLRGSGLEEMAKDVEQLRRFSSLLHGGAVDEIVGKEDLRTLCDLGVAASSTGENDG